ncbi:urease accessory protein UreD [Meridianimarinicoccus aquatilis]|uniref:Urease accessory protein UreD n=1 Tax=Meridianimarinicoccus aquatilis TaxID=2552766 RepID=A0A4R6B470_9RHOB|nr:urease accessory protein UreD [Fluviibacterium aquatile]TDL91222.1 urease accessory protein UreD [Fluviibacterium aquatile]
MNDLSRLTATTATPAVHQRTRGLAQVGLERGGPRGVRLTRLYQRGSAKVFLPQIYRDRPEIVFLNTAGGLTGGDDMQFDLTLGEGVAAVATTQTAERAYESLGDPARMNVNLKVGSGGVLHWLPQETILFDRSTLSRRTVADLEGDSELVMCETLVLGRAAMGEKLTDLRCHDWREVRRDGRPVLLEPFELCTDALRERANPALLGGAVAVASLALLTSGAQDRLGLVRATLADLPPSVRAAASGWNDKLVVRALSSDAHALRKMVAATLGVLTGAALPRVWAI